VNVHKNAKLTPAGRALLVNRVLREDYTPPRAAITKNQATAAMGVLRGSSLEITRF